VWHRLTIEGCLLISEKIQAGGGIDPVATLLLREITIRRLHPLPPDIDNLGVFKTLL
jgi:hypothetical protein